MNNTGKNQYVKAQLTNALIDLLKTKKLTDISISELTKHACVGRVSFYRNYNDINDILIDHANYLMQRWSENFMQKQNASVLNLFGSFFMHYKEHREFYEIMYQNGITQPILEAIKNKIDYGTDEENQPAYRKAFFAYGMYGWILEWMKRGMTEDADAINAMLLENDHAYQNIVDKMGS